MAGFPKSPLADALQSAEDVKNARMRELLDKVTAPKAKAKPAAKPRAAAAKKATGLSKKPAKVVKAAAKVAKKEPFVVLEAGAKSPRKKRGSDANPDTSPRAREAKAAPKPYVFQSEEIFATVLKRLVDGETLIKICSEPEMPTRTTIYDWISKDKELERRYSVAVQLKADKLVEETLEIADDGSRDTYTDSEGNERTDTDVIQRSKLRVEARWKYAAAVSPKKYGARQALDVDLNVHIKAEELEDRIGALLSKAAGGRG